MTDDKKQDDKDRKKVSDEEMEDVAGGFSHHAHVDNLRKDKKRADSGADDHNSTRSNHG
jgi:hypothetical protein